MCSSNPRKCDDALYRTVEAILFIAGEQGATASEIAEATGVHASGVKQALQYLFETLPLAHGLEVMELGGRWYMTTAADVSDVLERYHQINSSDRVRLSKAAMETLAVVAYGQPVTRSEVESIRGVRSDRVVETLLNHGLIRIAGRRKSTGSPLLYRTTEKFLKIFGLSGISDLPTVAEIEALHRSSGEEQEKGEKDHDDTTE